MRDLLHIGSSLYILVYIHWTEIVDASSPHIHIHSFHSEQSIMGSDLNGDIKLEAARNARVRSELFKFLSGVLKWQTDWQARRELHRPMATTTFLKGTFWECPSVWTPFRRGRSPTELFCIESTTPSSTATQQTSNTTSGPSMRTTASPTSSTSSSSSAAPSSRATGTASWVRAIWVRWSAARWRRKKIRNYWTSRRSWRSSCLHAVLGLLCSESVAFIFFSVIWPCWAYSMST